MVAIEIGLSFSTQGFRGKYAMRICRIRQFFSTIILPSSAPYHHNERQTEEIPRGLEPRGASWIFLHEKNANIQY
jgi:hypothetical protein